jgi:hyperosmotically inducible periplasmic protein
MSSFKARGTATIGRCSADIGVPLALIALTVRLYVVSGYSQTSTVEGEFIPMKAVIGSVVCAAALYIAGPLPAQAAAPQKTTAAKPSEKSIDARITQRMKADPTLKKYNIHVSVDGGVAKLTGTVATEADRSKAGTLAKVDGITSVDNQLVVDLSAGTTGTAGTIKEKTKEGAEKTGEGAKKVGEKTVEGAKKVGGATKDGLSKTGEVITDTWITTKIKADMVNEDLLKDSDIEVHTNNHIVTMSGTVMSPAGRARAVAIAKGTDGVKRVIDKITIGPKK